MSNRSASANTLQLSGVERYGRKLAGLLLLLGLAPAWLPAAEQVCVPDPDSKGWLCGSEEAMADVQPRSVSRSPSQTPSAPPAYLLDPSRAAQLQYQNQPVLQTPPPAPPPPPPPATPAAREDPFAAMQGSPVAAPQPALTTPAAPIDSPPPAPAPPQVAPTAALATPPASPTAPAKPKEAPAPAQTAPTATANAAEPASTRPAAPPAPQAASNIAKMAELTTDSAPSTSPTASAPAAPAPPPTPSNPTPAAPPAVASAPPPAPAASSPSTPPAPPKPAPANVSTPSASPPMARFSGWGSGEYTIQLVAADDPAEFAAFARGAGLDLNSLYQVRLQQPERTWWLLCYGRFDSLAQAKQALSELNPNARAPGAWPRRVGPLQAELSR